MKYLDFITGIINEAVTASLPVDNVQILGVAQLVRTERQGRPVTWPAVYTEKGELTYAGIDDKYAVCAYHRAMSMANQFVSGGYGDSIGDMRLTHRMSFVVYAHRDAIGMNADQLALHLHFIIPELVKELPRHFKQVRINISDVVLNTEQVFNEEFRNVDFFLGPEHVLLKCNYTIESIINKRCFNTQCSPIEAA